MLKMLSGLAAIALPKPKYSGPSWRAPHSAVRSVLGTCECRHCRTARAECELRTMRAAAARREAVTRREAMTRREFLTGRVPV